MANQNESNIVALNSLSSNSLSNRARESDTASRLNRPAAYQAKIHRHMTAPLIQLQEKSQQLLMKSLQDMFDKIDDALFELAEKSVHNSEQNIFFESMREVRLKRIDIEAQYADSFGDGFVELFHPVATDKTAASLASTTDAGLSLMADEAVEEMVAMDAMVAKAEKQLSAPLAALCARIGSLAPVDIQRLNNPLGPQRLCDKFSDACLQLNIDIKARLVVFKLYDKYVVGALDKLYTQANEQLIAHNILPDYRLTQRRSERSASIVEKANSVTERLLQGSSQQGSVANGQTAEPQEIYQLLQQLNHLAVTDTASNPSLGDSPLAHPLAAALKLLPVSTKPAIGHELLLQLLTTLQQDPARIAGYSDTLADDDNIPVLMPKQLTQGLSHSLNAIADGGDHSIGQGERDVISFVTLLFQFVLDDRSLAEPMKAAISRLQIPIIKVAMQDAGFFSEQAHPARRLLNEMTTAALGWIAEDNYQNDSLYQCVCATVERVSNEFVDDTQLFSDVLADFISFVDYEKKRADLREKRVVDAETGRDRSESARDYVAKLIEDKNLEHCAPDFVSAMIKTSWNNMLFLTYLKKGLESQEWLDAVRAMDDLLWTVAPERFIGDRAGIIHRIPAMLKFLRQGLNSINFDSYAAGEFFAHLEHFHLDVMQRPEPLAYYNVPSNTVPVCSMKDAVDTADEEIEALSLKIADESDDPYIAKAKMLGVGQWVEFIDAGEDGDEDKKVRCRLAAILRNSGKRIFASRTGVKAGEYTVKEIADRLANESVLLLEDAQLFDKALSSIIDDLRQSRQAAHA